MMHLHNKPKILLTLSAGAAALAISACSSSGSAQRVSSIGAKGPQGAQGETGPQGPAGPQGAQGSPGPQGPAGADGQNGVNGQNGADGQDGNFNLGDAGMLATGGLIGPNGLAGTGLLANTGDPDNALPIIANVQTEGGNLVNVVADAGFYAASVTGEALPGSAPLTGAVLGVVSDTGQTLVQSGNGEVYLVDGLTAAPGDLVTATIGEAYVLGGSEADPLIGASVLSAGQQNGDLATVGVGSGGELVALETMLLPEPDTSLVDGVINSAGETAGVVVRDASEPLGEIGDVLIGGASDTLGDIGDVIIADTNETLGDINGAQDILTINATTEGDLPVEAGGGSVPETGESLVNSLLGGNL